MSPLLVVILLLLITSIIASVLYYFLKFKPSQTPQTSQTPQISQTPQALLKNAECILNNNSFNEQNLDDSYYNFDKTKSILGKDLLTRVIEKFKFIFNKENFALSSGTVLDVSQTDPTKFYYVGKLVKSNTLSSSKNGGSNCLEFPSTVYKPMSITEPCLGYTDISTNISQDCYNSIWSSNCITTPPIMGDWHKSQTKSGLVSDTKSWAALTSDMHRAGCYGADKTKWPGYIQQDTCRSELNGGVCNGTLTSLSGEYKAIMQGDGNFVIYRNGSYIWDSKTSGRGVAPHKVIMQGDGNLVVYDKDGKFVWASLSNGRGVGPWSLKMQDDGNLVVYDSKGRATWSRITGVLNVPASYIRYNRNYLNYTSKK
jgi:hypothetical protein